jgi:benzoyl-CoA reductase/2-hydroxyglutaryl-CoA dehydratase subunit BcrC/BadD/HgdB
MPFFSLIKSSMLMPKEEHNKILEALVGQMDSSTRRLHIRDSARVFLSGMFVHPLEIFQWMDEAGLVVVDDDLAIGSRYFSYEVEGKGEAMEALADSYFQRIPSPLVEGNEDRLHFILKGVRENNLDGVIFVHLKFCEPFIFDYPDLKKGLDREGIPSLFIETDFRSLAEGQIKTRLQAFREVLSHHP